MRSIEYLCRVFTALHLSQFPQAVVNIYFSIGRMRVCVCWGCRRFFHAFWLETVLRTIASVQRSCDTIQDAPHARVVPRMPSKQTLRLRQPCDTPPQLALLLLALLSSRSQHLSDYALPIYQSNCCVREPIPTLNAALSMPPNAPGCIGWPLDIGGKNTTPLRLLDSIASAYGTLCYYCFARRISRSQVACVSLPLD